MKKTLFLALSALFFAYSGHSQSISGVPGACVGASSFLRDSLTGGTWSSSNTSIATVNSSTGEVTGVSAGTAVISYTIGSSVSTSSFTVSPTPARITGVPSVLCVGSSATLADATTGGSWSSGASYVASIGSSTGVVTGVSVGTTTVYYTVGVGCYAEASVTVSSSGRLADSISCAPSVCVGSTTTATIYTSGGTWSSSSSSIATINPSTGVITGVSAGTAIITYSVSSSCGTMSTYASITVTSSGSAGTITGPSTVSTGGMVTLYDGISGGTWSSSNASIASVDASTGDVYGVAAGTATISYLVAACGGTAVATAPMTVTAFGGISGDVLFDSGSYYGAVKVWLIKYTSSTGMLTAVDSQYVSAAGASVHYEFTSPATDSYRVKAAVIDSSSRSTGYIPTYHDTSYYWYSANVINHISGTADIHKNIGMAYGATTSGPGFIGGSVTAGANRGTSTTVPVVGLSVYALNTATGKVMAYTTTDTGGHYSFSGLNLGTYIIFPEALSYRTTPIVGINVTGSSYSFNLQDFVQHTISKTITPKTSGVESVAATSNFAVFPNPANSKLNIVNIGSTNEKAEVTLTDVTGAVISRTTIGQSSNNCQIDLSSVPNGLYIVTVHSATAQHTEKIQVQH